MLRTYGHMTYMAVFLKVKRNHLLAVGSSESGDGPTIRPGRKVQVNNLRLITVVA